MVTRRLRGADVLIPLGVLGVIVVLDALLPPSVVVSGAFAVAAIVASATTTVRRTALVAVSALVLAALSAVWNDDLGTVRWWVRLAVTFIIGILAVLLARSRVRRERALRHMTAIAEAAQGALLRAMPSSIGSLRFAARYVSATKEALVGGDLYEVVETPDGVRVIVGDARGKGLDAVQMAATVLAAFRRAAAIEPSLSAIAADLDGVVTAVAGDEDFVTAVLAEFDHGSTVTVLNCGHHPPLLSTEADTARYLDTGEPQPPLGLHPIPNPVTSLLPAGARLLFYTDGLVETRNRQGVFLPLGDSAAILRAGSLGNALDGLLSQVVDHAGDQIDDDMALVLVERAGPGAAERSPRHDGGG
jgi:serine phosphatase RsbU (regulator of sigma subunit)